MDVFPGYASQPITTEFQCKALAMPDPTWSANLLFASASGRESDRLNRGFSFWIPILIILIILFSLNQLWLQFTPHTFGIFHNPFKDSQALSSVRNDSLMTKKILKYSKHSKSQTDGAPLSGLR